MVMPFFFFFPCLLFFNVMFVYLRSVSFFPIYIHRFVSSLVFGRLFRGSQGGSYAFPCLIYFGNDLGFTKSIK